METIESSLEKTESATRKLIEGIDSYLEILRGAEFPVFVSSTTDKDAFAQEYSDWAAENEEPLRASRDAQADFMAEKFAMANLCGALLQTASMGINMFSSKQPVPPIFKGIVEEKKPVTKYFIGREERGGPLGMIIYAGRNQYNHFDERSKLRNPAKKVFELLSRVEVGEEGQILTDPAFDLQNQRLLCFSGNIVGLLGWRSYEVYENDMLTMLGGKEGDYTLVTVPN